MAAEVGVREPQKRACEIVRAVRDRRARYGTPYRGQPVEVLLPLAEAPAAKGRIMWEEWLRWGQKIAQGWREEGGPVPHC